MTNKADTQKSERANHKTINAEKSQKLGVKTFVLSCNS